MVVFLCAISYRELRGIRKCVFWSLIPIVSSRRISPKPLISSASQVQDRISVPQVIPYNTAQGLVKPFHKEDL